MRHVEVFASDLAMAQAVVAHIQESLKAPYYLAISGGNSPMVLFAQMQRILTEQQMDKIRFYWVDERMVNAGSPQSNYGNFMRLMGKSVKSQNVFPIMFLEDAHTSRVAYGQVLQDTVPHEKGYPQFDAVILGLGTDGHTASLFPTDLQALASTDAVIQTYNTTTQQERISLSLNTINNAHQRIFWVTGTDKQEIVKQVLVDSNPNYPASHVQAHNTTWYLDQDAAMQLDTYILK